MKQSRFRQLINSQTPAAQKVYAAVPAQEEWDSITINRELYRMGTRLNFAILEGCLNTLTEAKLIKEVKRGVFKRIPVEPELIKADVPVIPQKELIMANAPKEENKPSTLFDILADLSKRAQIITDQIDDLREDIEKAALSAQAEQDRAAVENQKDAEELTKLRQLKALLAGLKD